MDLKKKWKNIYSIKYFWSMFKQREQIASFFKANSILWVDLVVKLNHTFIFIMVIIIVKAILDAAMLL